MSSAEKLLEGRPCPQARVVGARSSNLMAERVASVLSAVMLAGDELMRPSRVLSASPANRMPVEGL